MIIDTSFFSEFWEAEKINYYDELMTYMKQFTKDFYKKHNIFVQRHHIVPAFECEDLDKEEEIWLPVSIHFKAHILRAREYSLSDPQGNHNDKNVNISIGNYTEAYCILKKFKSLQGIFYKDYKLAEECHVKYFKPATFEAQFGKKRADKIKRKISYAMSNLDPIIIEQRNNKIADYAQNRPESHNKAISLAKQKMVINVQTNKFYKNVEDAAAQTGISISSIRSCCQGKIKSVKGQQFDYII